MSFMGLDIGKRAIMVSQTALNIVGHNMANANTEGYTRQVAELTASTPYGMPSLTSSTAVGLLGTGVDISEIARIRDAYVDNQYRYENTSAGYWTATEQSLDKIQIIINEPSDDGLRSVMDEFWEAWQELSANPENESTRAVVSERGQAVADAFQHTYKQLVDLREDLNANVKIDVDQINALGSQIKDLNLQIATITLAGKQPNDLEDKRDLLIDQLSKLVDINLSKDDKGMVAIQIGGSTLVQGVQFNALSTKEDSYGMSMVVWKDTGARTQISGGDLMANLDARGKTDLPDEQTPSSYAETVPTLINQLNSLAKTIVVKTNQIHKQGFSLNNATQTADGTPFFTMPAGSPDQYTDWAKNMSVDSAIVDDPNNIAASGAPTYDTSGNKSNFGDGCNALVIAQLKQNMNNESIVYTTSVAVNSQDIQVTVRYDNKDYSVSVSGSDYSDANSRAAAIQSAILAATVPDTDIQNSGITVSDSDGRLVFTSSNSKFTGITDLQIYNNTTSSWDDYGSYQDVNNGQASIQTQNIPDISAAPAFIPTLSVLYGGQTILISLPSATYTNTSLASAIQTAINANLPASSPGITVSSAATLPGPLVFSSTDNNFKGIQDLNINNTSYGDYSVLMVRGETNDDYWRAVAAEVGVESQAATRNSENQDTLVSELDSKRQSVSGVSLDEEATDMIKFQHAFNAASRFITTVDDMLDTLINKTGVVGR